MPASACARCSQSAYDMQLISFFSACNGFRDGLAATGSQIWATGQADQFNLPAAPLRGV
jgi:hypothetical protein